MIRITSSVIGSCAYSRPLWAYVLNPELVRCSTGASGSLGNQLVGLMGDSVVPGTLSLEVPSSGSECIDDESITKGRPP